MFRFTFLFVIAIQILVISLVGAFIFALVFHPDAIGATFANIILGF